MGKSAWPAVPELCRYTDEIATKYNLSLADVYAALAYYFDHREEIDTSIREGKAFAEALRERTPSKLKQRSLKNREIQTASGN